MWRAAEWEEVDSFLVRVLTHSKIARNYNYDVLEEQEEEEEELGGGKGGGGRGKGGGTGAERGVTGWLWRKILPLLFSLPPYVSQFLYFSATILHI